MLIYFKGKVKKKMILNMAQILNGIFLHFN